MRTRVKVCGITRIQDATAAIEAGVDALGLVFYPPSSRYLSIKQAEEIVRELAPFVTVVGLFLDAEREQIDSVLEHVPLDLLQFHGSESPDLCASFQLPYIKALGMHRQGALEAFIQSYPESRGFLLDSHGAGEAGGTGKRFDWTAIPRGLEQPIILAGGLNPENVGEAIRVVRPYAIDLSSGVEITPGVKDSKKIMSLMNEVRQADYEC